MSCQVKICGLTNAEDAGRAVAAGAHALGLNLWPGSKRYLPLREAEWLADLAGEVARVAVLVDPTLDEIRSVVATGWFEAVQLHGHEDDLFVRAAAGLGLPVIRALRVRDVSVLRDAQAWLEHGTVLLDSFHGTAPGGTGRTWDWSLAAEFTSVARGRAWILSGGLNCANVSDACAIVQPNAVDVASGVEAAGNPRRKDDALLRRFLALVKLSSDRSDTNPRIF